MGIRNFCFRISSSQLGNLIKDVHPQIVPIQNFPQASSRGSKKVCCEKGCSKKITHLI